MSHIITVTTVIQDKQALENVVKSIGGTIIGDGTHQFFSGTCAGWAFRLPGWKYPIVLCKNGTLSYDTYNDQWGNSADLELLKERYTMEVARQYATSQGWYVEDRAEGGLTLHLAGGRTVTVEPGGKINAEGFMGHGCTQATRGLAEALGRTASEIRKEEYENELARVNVVEE